LFNRAFDLATKTAAGSLSIPVTWPAPKHFAARARIPLPVPRSTSDQPRLQRQVSCSNKRSDMAVVACSPVPNANEAGMIMWERPLCRDSRDTEVPFVLEITNRFPILIGLESTRVNCFGQLRGKASMRPPNPLSSADELLRDRHTISSSRHLRPGLRTITSWPLACFWRSSSCALTQCSSAVLRHRYTEKRSASQGWPASRSLGHFWAARLRQGYPERIRGSSLRFTLRSKRRLERVTRLELATSTLARWCSTN
jgi:hypothetical protein